MGAPLQPHTRQAYKEAQGVTKVSWQVALNDFQLINDPTREQKGICMSAVDL